MVLMRGHARQRSRLAISKRAPTRSTANTTIRYRYEGVGGEAVADNDAEDDDDDASDVVEDGAKDVVVLVELARGVMDCCCDRRSDAAASEDDRSRGVAARLVQSSSVRGLSDRSSSNVSSQSSNE